MRYLVSLILVLAFTQFSSAQQNKASVISASSGSYAPNLYSEKIKLQILLVNLPGADKMGSFFRGDYSVFFVPEGEIEKIAQAAGGYLDELTQDKLANKILLSKGHFNRANINRDRIVEISDIPFKSKVPDELRTMLGQIVIFYTIRIYDAKLKKNVYKDSSFTYLPFERTDKSAARRIFHLSFFVNNDGKLYTSSLPRDKSSTSW